MESGESAQEVTFAYEKAIESAMQLGENLFLYRSRIDLYKLKGDTSDVMSDIRQMYERFAAEPLCVENEDALRILGKA